MRVRNRATVRASVKGKRYGDAEKNGESLARLGEVTLIATGLRNT